MVSGSIAVTRLETTVLIGVITETSEATGGTATTRIVTVSVVEAQFESVATTENVSVPTKAKLG